MAWIPSAGEESVPLPHPCPEPMSALSAPTRSSLTRPSVGLLFNPTTPEVMADCADLVEHLSVNPGQMVHDLGDHSPVGERFAFPAPLLEALASLRQDKPLNAHSFSLSLPSASPLDEALARAITQVGERLGGFCWLSEHLNVIIPPQGVERHSEGGLALPVAYNDETLTLLRHKLTQLRQITGLPILLENPALLTPLQDLEMEEPTFLNHLYRSGHCGVLLDLHNLLVSERNGGMAMGRYLEQLDPAAVVEVHLAGGEEIYGVYTDSHSQLTPAAVWAMAEAFLPHCPNLKAISFEYNDTYFACIGSAGVRSELERMHRLADRCTQAHRIALAAPDPIAASPC